MIATVLVGSLGHSIGSKTLSAAMRELGLNTKPSITAHRDDVGHAYAVTVKAKGVTLTFDGYQRYRQEFGKPRSRMEPWREW